MKREMYNSNNYNRSVSKRQSQLNKHKKQQLKLKMFFLTMTTVFIFIIGASAFSMNANATSAEGANDYKYYANYCIEPGDTLWSIAEEHIDYRYYDSIKSYAKELQAINHITGDHIMNGTYIMVPYFSDEVK